MPDIRETVRHLLANMRHVRILDITDRELENFANELAQHDLVLIDKSGQFK
jgi:hypothetical protein